MLVQWLKHHQIYFFTLLTGLLITVYQIYSQPLFITDSFLYLKAAIQFEESGFNAAMQVYPWPFYSILIALTHKLTGLNIIASGYFVNAFFQSLLVLIFLTIIKKFDASKRTLISGAIIILLYTKLNTIRPDFLRDFGYWSTILIALWNLLQFSETSKIKHGVYWCIFSLISTLFRLEGIVLLALSPFVLLTLPEWTWQQRIKKLLKISVLPVTITLIALLYTASHTGIGVGRIAGLPYLFTHYVDFVFNAFTKHSNTIATQILPIHAAKHSGILLLGGSATIFLMNLFKALTPTYSVLCLYTLFTGKLKIDNKMMVLLGFIFINLIICIFYFAWRYFIISRYLMAMNLGILILVSLGLSQLYENIKIRPHSAITLIFFIYVSTGLILMATHNLNLLPKLTPLATQSKYYYLKQAGLWLQHNKPDGTPLITNQETIAFYAAKNKSDWLNLYASNQYDDNHLTQHKQKENAWFAINITAKNRELYPVDDFIRQHSVAIFQNYRSDTVYVLNSDTVTAKK